MADKLVGKIKHYYDKISVAVVEVSSPIKVGDKIKISGHENEVEQVVESMQVDHQSVAQAKKGDAVGMKVDGVVKEGDDVYKVE